MASEAEVIQEFLVKLGFKTDDDGKRKFANSVAFANARVQLLVDGVTKAGEKLFQAVNGFVTSMDALYFSAQRSNASVTNIKSFEFAAEQLGVTAQQARASIEGLAGFMRDIPGSEGFLASLGVKTRNANGELRDTTEILVDLGNQFKKMPWYLAKQYTSMLGIDDNTLRALRSGEFEKGFRKAQEKFSNVGFDKAAEQAKKLKHVFREISSEFEILGVQVMGALLEKFGPKLEQFIHWLQQNGPQITASIVRAVEIFISVCEKLAPILGFILDLYLKLDSASDGWVTTVLTLAAGLKFLGISLTGILGSVGSLTSGVMALTGAMGALLVKATAVGAVAYAAWEAGSALYENVIAGTDVGDKIGEGIAHTMAFFGNREAQESINRMNANLGGTGGNTSNNSVNQNTNINVYGSEAANAGRSVADEQDRVNSRLVRNFKGAVQ